MATKTKKNPSTGIVLVRTYSAGVHFGKLKSRNGTEATLTDARRIWRWRGANTLSEVATKGVAQEYTRISEPVPEILLTQAVEIIPVSGEALATMGSRWAP